MPRNKFVTTYPEDGPLERAREIARANGTLTPARNLENVEGLVPEGFDPRDPAQNPPVFSWENHGQDSSDAESEAGGSSSNAGPSTQPAGSNRRRVRDGRPDQTEAELAIRRRRSASPVGTPTRGTNAAAPGPSSQTPINPRLNGNRDVHPGQILKWISYAHHERKLMRGNPWTEEADLLILYLRRKGIQFKRIASQFIEVMTGHEKNACQQRWQRLKRWTTELSPADKIKFEEEMTRIERERFPDGIPPEPPVASSVTQPLPLQPGSAAGAGPSAPAQVNATENEDARDSDSSLSDPPSSIPSPTRSSAEPSNQDA